MATQHCPGTVSRKGRSSEGCQITSRKKLPRKTSTACFLLFGHQLKSLMLKHLYSGQDDWPHCKQKRGSVKLLKQRTQDNLNIKNFDQIVNPLFLGGGGGGECQRLGLNVVGNLMDRYVIIIMWVQSTVKLFPWVRFVKGGE